MTSTDPWDNPDFIRKRIQEQVDYLNDLPFRDPPLKNDRFLELGTSAFEVKMIFVRRLHELTNEPPLQ